MFIAVDLKVIEGLAGAVARAASVSEDRILAGLVRLWHRCWADEIDHLDHNEFSGVFGFDGLDRIIVSLASFGFIEARDSERSWRVKGADRYLRLKESRRRGAAATNAKRARSRATHNHALERGLSDAQSRSLTESPNTEHRVTEEKILRAVKPPAVPKQKFPKPVSPPDPRHAPLVKALVEVYADQNFGAAYDFTPRDARNVSLLLAKSADSEEIIYRWKTALRLSADPFQSPKTRDLTALVRDWNAYPVVKDGQRKETRL